MARTALLHALHTHTHTQRRRRRKKGGGGRGGRGEFAGSPEPFSNTEINITRKMVKIIIIITHTVIFKTHALQTLQLTCTEGCFRLMKDYNSNYL